ncbi:MAG: PEGA domain-containing protein [candidate division WOR-3 bacterium]
MRYRAFRFVSLAVVLMLTAVGLANGVSTIDRCTIIINAVNELAEYGIVYLNGREVGNLSEGTFVLTNLSVGEYNIFIFSEKFDPWETKVTLSKKFEVKVVNFEAKRTPRVRTVRINSNPTKASLIINGTIIAETPWQGNLEVGETYLVKLFKEGYDPEELELNVSNKGSSLEVMVNLSKSPTNLKVHKEYTPYDEGDNIRSVVYTDGKGVFYDDWDNYINEEIGVLEIIEEVDIVRVEITGSACVYPVTLTVNGVKRKPIFSHDMEPYGSETLVFDIAPSKLIKIYTSVHTDEENHGFRIEKIVLYKQ